jgi:hypothetical protein
MPTNTPMPTPTQTPISGAVQVLPLSYAYVSNDFMYVVGEVLNDTSDTLSFVDVFVNFFDAGGQLVGTNHPDGTYLWLLDLPASERGCVFISINPVPPNWSYYQFETPTYEISSSSPNLTIFNESFSYNSTSGDIDITGQVQNDGNQTSNYVSVGGTVYSAGDVSLGCSFDYVDSTNLDPGLSGAFDVNFWGYYRDYNDVAYYKLRVAGDPPP